MTLPAVHHLLSTAAHGAGMAEDHSATKFTGLRLVSRAGWRITSRRCLSVGKHSLNCLIIIRVGN